jgi:hypothetical protein
LCGLLGKLAARAQIEAMRLDVPEMVVCRGRGWAQARQRHCAFSEGEAGVEVWFSEKKVGNAGLIVKVSKSTMREFP